MAGPSSPFASLAGQQNGATATAGRGRGAHGRSSFQSKNINATRGNVRGRGRGTPAARSGRGRAASLNTWHRKPETNTNTGGSQFAQSKQNNPFARAASGFDGTMVDSSRDPRRTTSATQANGTGGVLVEDASVLSRYSERYEQLKINRTKERAKAIKDGLMADPNQPTSLNQAITPVGTCTSMCPEFERVERIVQKMVDKSEKYLHPSTSALQYMETKMLKRFRRSAAGYDEQLPSDIRTPKTLLQSVNYLIRHVVGGSEPLGLIHKFVWDRTRSIRNDFSVQQLTQEDHVKIAVTCLERIARFHIVSLHLLSSPANTEPFDRHQEREQLNNTMLSLMYYYDDNRGRIAFSNEDEFRSYYIILSIHDQRPDLEARVQKWPPEMRNSPRVQVALELFAAAGNPWEYQGTLDARRPNVIAQGFYARFFKLVDSPSVSYLMACVAEIYFNHMRQTAIRSIWKAYCRSPASQQHKNEEWTIDELATALCFDDTDQTIKFCEDQDLDLAENANGELYLNWGSRPVDSIAFQPSSDHVFSDRIVELKRSGRNLVAVILGLNIKESANLGMIDPSLLSKRSAALPAPDPEDDSLFVNEDGNDAQSSGFQVNEAPSASPIFDAPQNTAPSLRNESEGPPRPPSDGPSIFQTNGSASPFQPAPPQPSQGNKTFSSLFSSRPSTSPSPFAPSPSPTLNPFAATFAPQQSEPAQNNNVFATSPTTQSSAFPSPFTAKSESNQSGSLFPTASAPQQSTALPSPFTTQKSAESHDTKPGSATQQPTAFPSPFTAKSTASQNGSLFPRPSVPQQSQAFPSPFTFPKPAEAPEVEAPEVKAPSDSTAQQPAAFPSPFTSKPGGGQTSSVFSTSPATQPSAPLSSPFQPKAPIESQPASTFPAASAPQRPSTSSLFTAKKPEEPHGPSFFPTAPTTRQPAASPFSFTAKKSEETQSPSLFPTATTFQRGPAFPTPFTATKPEGTQCPFPNTPTSTSPPSFPPPFTAKKPGESQNNIFTPPPTQQPAPVFSPASSLFPAAGKNGESAPLVSTTPQRESTEAKGEEAENGRLPESRTTAPPSGRDSQQEKLSFHPAYDGNRAVTGVHTAHPEPENPVIVTEDSAAAPQAEERVADEAPVSDENVQTPTWIQLLKDAALKRRQLPSTSRKRVYKEEKEEEPEEDSPKAAKLSKSAPTPNKTSLALSSLKPLPKLPILERIESMTARKPAAENKPEPSKPSKVDEDELLLSAARIAAESLKSGQKLYDDPSAYHDSHRSSYSPGSSFSSSFRLSRSGSPQSHINGHDVAYAPDTDLGMGRTMSRTEQRIRMTGGKGLAYKPLDFTPQKKRKGKERA